MLLCLLLFHHRWGGCHPTLPRPLISIVCTARTAVAFLTRTACRTDAVRSLKVSMRGIRAACRAAARQRDFANISFCACLSHGSGTLLDYSSHGLPAQYHISLRLGNAPGPVVAARRVALYPVVAIPVLRFKLGIMPRLYLCLHGMRLYHHEV